VYLFVKHLHMTLALISIIGFVIRGTLALNHHPLLTSKWAKISPHIVDTLLLSAAVFLAWSLKLNPFTTPWLLAKIIALLVYIILGTQVIKNKGSKTRQRLCFVAAILTFSYMLSVAFTKQMVPF
jgi:uncharacterized membrane protein SirB2